MCKIFILYLSQSLEKHKQLSRSGLVNGLRRNVSLNQEYDHVLLTEEWSVFTGSGVHKATHEIKT